MKRLVFVAILGALITHSSLNGQKVYRSGGGEIIFSSANVNFIPDDGNAVDVNTNLRFTLFFHVQQFLNLDITDWLGFYTGIGIRNIGLITDDLYQNMGFINVDQNNENWNKSTKIKRRSYSLGFPLALKVGSFGKNYFLYAGGEYEYEHPEVSVETYKLWPQEDKVHYYPYPYYWYNGWYGGPRFGPPFYPWYY